MGTEPVFGSFFARKKGRLAPSLSWPFGLAVTVIDDLEPLKGEIAVIDIDQVSMPIDDLAQAAGRDDLDVFAAQLFLELTDDVFGLTQEAIEQAGLHVAGGVLGQDGAGRFDLDFRQLGSL